MKKITKAEFGRHAEQHGLKFLGIYWNKTLPVLENLIPDFRNQAVTKPVNQITVKHNHFKSCTVYREGSIYIVYCNENEEFSVGIVYATGSTGQPGDRAAWDLFI